MSRQARHVCDTAVAIVARHYHIHPDTLRTSCARKHAQPRAIAMWLAAQRGVTTTQIGRHFHRDHSTVSYNVRKIDRWADPLRDELHQRFAATLGIDVGAPPSPAVVAVMEQLGGLIEAGPGRRQCAEAVVAAVAPHLEAELAGQLKAMRAALLRLSARVAREISVIVGGGDGGSA